MVWWNQFPNLHPQLYQAYFVRGENLAETDVLINTVDLSGLNTEDARDCRADNTSRPLMKTGTMPDRGCDRRPLSSRGWFGRAQPTRNWTGTGWFHLHLFPISDLFSPKDSSNESEGVLVFFADLGVHSWDCPISVDNRVWFALPRWQKEFLELDTKTRLRMRLTSNATSHYWWSAACCLPLHGSPPSFLHWMRDFRESRNLNAMCWIACSEPKYWRPHAPRRWHIRNRNKAKSPESTSEGKN